MMAVIDNCAVTLAGQRHVFFVLVFPLWCAERASNAGGLVEMMLC
jgi:hypothetical protein